MGAVVVGAVALGGCGTTTHEPRNLGAAKAEVRAYEASGGYARDLAAVARRAEAWLRERAAREAPGERLAVVFDVDETLLSNAGYFRELDFGWNDATWEAWIGSARATPIGPVGALCRLAQSLGVEVVILTARAEAGRTATEKNLAAIEGLGRHVLLMQPDGDRRTAEVFKTEERRKLASAGLTLIANLGDQESDLRGGWSERTFKLPNPFYRTE